MCPEDYHSLTKCIGTYCALLHTLFGSRCKFYEHCMSILKVMTSKRVAERQQAFTPLFCRQVVWAIIEDGRAYFSMQLTVNDFIRQHPDDTKYPESTIIEIKQNICTQSPIFCSSFPHQWLGPSHERAPTGGHSFYLPLVSVVHTYTPSVVSGDSAPTLTHLSSQMQLQTSPLSQAQPEVQIQATNIHPAIKTAMAAYIQKFCLVRLT